MRTDEDEAALEKNSLNVAESKEIIEAWQEGKEESGTACRARQIKLFGGIYMRQCQIRVRFESRWSQFFEALVKRF